MSEIIENVKEFTSAVIKKADVAYRVAKLKINRATLNRLLAEQYIELGKKTYIMTKNKINDSDELVSMTVQIDGTKKRIAVLDRRIESILELVRCPNCNAVVKIKNPYCSHCGMRLMTEQESIEENENEMNIPEDL